jgi:hypothetical protein
MSSVIHNDAPMQWTRQMFLRHTNHGHVVQISAMNLGHTDKPSGKGFHLAEFFQTVRPLWVFFFSWAWDWAHLLLRPLFGLLYQPQMIDDECGAVGGMRIGRGNRSTPNKPAPVPFCPPRIPYELSRFRNRTAVMGSWRLTAWAMARPSSS